ncbi:MAG: hypothetical protein QOG89_227 [Thermomicrobiales bacterium]|nr:hypothetical protein [Thermomicrobiales bacterium]
MAEPTPPPPPPAAALTPPRRKGDLPHRYAGIGRAVLAVALARGEVRSGYRHHSRMTDRLVARADSRSGFVWLHRAPFFIAGRGDERKTPPVTDGALGEARSSLRGHYPDQVRRSVGRRGRQRTAHVDRRSFSCRPPAPVGRLSSTTLSARPPELPLRRNSIVGCSLPGTTGAVKKRCGSGNSLGRATRDATLEASIHRLSVGPPKCSILLDGRGGPRHHLRRSRPECHRPIDLPPDRSGGSGAGDPWPHARDVAITRACLRIHL